jgi:hypothetical protein
MSISDRSGTLLFPLETGKKLEEDKIKKQKESLLYVVETIV